MVLLNRTNCKRSSKAFICLLTAAPDIPSLLAASKTKHGRFTKLERSKAKARAKQGRIIRRELKELETWFIEHGHLKKDWRKDWVK